MRAFQAVGVTSFAFLCIGFASASPPDERALWIKVNENENHTTTIAVTEMLARHLLESGEPGKHFLMDDEEDILTKEMLRSVLDGEEDCVKVRDDDGAEIEVYMDDLNVPGHKRGDGKLILETYKEGVRTFRLSLPEIELEACDDADCETGIMETHFGWRGLLPFLAGEGGAVYIDSDEDKTEVWVYLQ